MSDPQEPVGEPVEDPESVDDVVGRAHEGLAEAEAAGRSATDPAETDPAGAEPSAAEPAGAESTGEEPAFTTPELNQTHAQTAADDRPADIPAVAPEPASEPTPVFDTTAATSALAPEPAASEPVASEPVAPQPVASEPVAPQPIFVQAPEEPRPRGNRAAAGGIGLIAAVCFAVLYLAAGLVIGLVSGHVVAAEAGTWLIAQLTTWGLWVPTAVFFIAFWLLGGIINRSRWGAWVIFGLLVGAAAWGGHLLGQLFEAPFWQITSSQGADIVNAQLFAPLAIAAFIIGRELTIWFGAWVAARGRRMTELNVEARREYERTLEAGPQLGR